MEIWNSDVDSPLENYKEGIFRKKVAGFTYFCNSKLLSELMITETNKQKRQSPKNPAFAPISCFYRRPLPISFGL